MLPSLKWIALGSCLSSSDCSGAPSGMVHPTGDHPLPVFHCIMSQGRHVPVNAQFVRQLRRL